MTVAYKIKKEGKNVWKSERWHTVGSEWGILAEALRSFSNPED
jgi:hypothetical protein